MYEFILEDNFARAPVLGFRPGSAATGERSGQDDRRSTAGDADQRHLEGQVLTGEGMVGIEHDRQVARQ